MTFVLDAYAARSCPLKTVNAFTPSLVAPSPERSAPPAWFHDADAIEAEVVASLSASGAALADLRDLRTGPAELAEQATLAAMGDGVELILGPTLPRDTRAHRSGRPTLLVREASGPGYHPVHLKMYRVTEPCPPERDGLVATALHAPRHPVRLPGRRFRLGQRIAVVLQLAHYWRLLEASGHAASHPWAGVIGLDQLPIGPTAAHGPGRLIAWLDLAAATVPPDPRLVDVPEQAAPISGLARYDAEHGWRVALAEAAASSSGEQPLLTPIMSPECRRCVWQEHCQAQLDADDLSVRINKAPLDVHEVRTLRRLGIWTVADLATADLESLLEVYLPHASHRPGSEERLRRAHRRALMMRAGVELERRTDGPLDLPRHELEIDVDIETSADDRVYLWGFAVDDPAGEPRYVSFSRFATLDDEEEAALAAEALGWLHRTVEGRDAAVYHYSDYELIRLRRLAERCPDHVGGWAVAFAEQHFVDLFGVVREHFFGANGLGLKTVATAVAGFAWRDEEPGGLNSQSWFAEAIGDDDPDVREVARVRVLEYNEDDVRATWHLRRWLREKA